MKSNQEKIQDAENSLNQCRSAASGSYWKPRYHVTAEANWINDPNGFCYYRGEYHLFFQHHPLSPDWGPMYWGHVKSRDLAAWDRLPIALAPSEEYDRDGCFSGSAIEKDGRLYLMYTGNVWSGPNHDTDLLQVQCLAVSEDGITFDKYEGNPVIEGAPEGDIHRFHIRDPKVWKHGEHYYCILGSRTKQHIGQVLLYRSPDLLRWEYIGVAAQRQANPGFMWECPDLFRLEDRDVLIFSPQGMKPEGELYHNLHQSGYIMGELDYNTGKLSHGEFHLLDYGFDFYAPQTALDEQGRRIMIAWMAMWESEMPERKHQWAGAMTIPRQLSMRNGRIRCTPVPELELLREREIRWENVPLEKELELDGISGDSLELELSIDAEFASRFGVKLRCSSDGREETVLTYDRAAGMLSLDRNFSGMGPGGVRKAPVQLIDNRLNLRIFIDRSSVGVFVNDGDLVMSARIYPGESSKRIRFFADGSVRLTRVRKWDLRRGIDVTEISD